MVPAPARLRLTRLAAAALLILIGCQPVEYSPYEVSKSRDPASSLAANIARIQGREATGSKPFTFAVIADTHSAYDELSAFVQDINADTSVRFLIVAGDITQFGLEKEYQWFEEILSHLKIPYISVIGNHDALANGAKLFKKRFGSLNYSFSYRNVKFVCINDNIWEFPFSVPDFSWLEAEMATAATGEKIFVVSHIPPFGDQFDEPMRDRFVHLLAKYHVALSIHGHMHNFHYTQEFGDGVPYLVGDNIEDRNYLKVSVIGDSIGVERIFY